MYIALVMNESQYAVYLIVVVSLALLVGKLIGKPKNENEQNTRTSEGEEN
jgi:hypothetical protein